MDLFVEGFGAPSLPIYPRCDPHPSLMPPVAPRGDLLRSELYNGAQHLLHMLVGGAQPCAEVGRAPAAECRVQGAGCWVLGAGSLVERFDIEPFSDFTTK